MTAVLAAVAAVALVLLVALVVVHRRSRRESGRARSALAELTASLAEASARQAQADEQKRAAEVRAAAADGRAKVAEQKAADAERRSGDAERRVAEAVRRADEMARAAGESTAARAVWELERLRVEREWLDVVGPDVPLPVPWDGTLASIVGTELSVIREVIGTPSELSVEETVSPPSPAAAALMARMSVELLRTLARSGEEMAVDLRNDGLEVVQPVSVGEEPPDLGRLAEVAGRAGLALSMVAAEGRCTARLEFVIPGEK